MIGLYYCLQFKSVMDFSSYECPDELMELIQESGRDLPFNVN